MPHVVELIAVAAIAIVLLLPKPSLDARPALVGDPIALERVALLEDRLYAEHTAERAIDLADAYLDVDRPDWALATLAPFGRGNPRVHLVRATAYAERLQPEASVDEADAGLAACDAAGPRCPEAVRVKFNVIANTMRALVERKIDPHQDPLAARRAVLGVLHAAKVPPGLHPPTK